MALCFLLLLLLAVVEAARNLFFLLLLLLLLTFFSILVSRLLHPKKATAAAAAPIDVDVDVCSADADRISDCAAAAVPRVVRASHLPFLSQTLGEILYSFVCLDEGTRHDGIDLSILLLFVVLLLQ